MLDDSLTFDQLWPADEQGGRPALLAIAGDSATGKTTLTHGLVQAVGAENCLEICVDDYHRYDREERKDKPFTPLHPKCNYMDIMEQHLLLISRGQSILKPIYNHDTGKLERPELIEPRPFGVIEGLLPLHQEGARACFDVTAYLDPPEELRIRWKTKRDTGKRGYNEDEVKAQLEKREPEAAEFIRPQRAVADIVVRFAPEPGDDDGPLGATLYLAPTIPHPPLTKVIDEEDGPVRLELTRDEDGRPVEALHIRPDVGEDKVAEVAQMCWAELGQHAPQHKALPPELGLVDEDEDERSMPLALTQLVLLYHLVRARTP